MEVVCGEPAFGDARLISEIGVCTFAFFGLQHVLHNVMYCTARRQWSRPVLGVWRL